MKVIGIARRADKLEKLSAELGPGFHGFAMDVTDEKAVKDLLSNPCES